MIMASGDRWSIMKVDGHSSSIMELAGTVSEVVIIYLFHWYRELCGS